jgi:hypothetical protein
MIFGTPRIQPAIAFTTPVAELNERNGDLTTVIGFGGIWGSLGIGPSMVSLRSSSIRLGVATVTTIPSAHEITRKQRLRILRSALSWGLVLILVGVYVAMRLGIKPFLEWFPQRALWRSLSPSGRDLIVGTAMATIGIWGVWDELNHQDRSFQPGIWRFRMFVGGVACLIGGLLLLLRAFGFLG